MVHRSYGRGELRRSLLPDQAQPLAEVCGHHARRSETAPVSQQPRPARLAGTETHRPPSAASVSTTSSLTPRVEDIARNAHRTPRVDALRIGAYWNRADQAHTHSRGRGW